MTRYNIIVDGIPSETLTELHWGHNLTMQEIGNIYGVHRDAISYGFKKRKLSQRTKAEAIKLAYKLHPERYHHTLSGERHPNWKGGRRKEKNGYVILFDPSRQHRRSYEHRIIASQKLGRPLKSGEIVHHLNGIKDDNRPENLIVIKQTEHNPRSLIHYLQARIRELEQLHFPI